MGTTAPTDHPPPRGEHRSYWDKHAKRYDRAMRLLAPRFGRVVALVVERVGEADHVLEVAAGTGLLTAPVARRAARVVATDYAEQMVDRLRARVGAEGLSNVECLQRDVYALGFEPERFDVVMAANVLHILPDAEGALAALRRVLKPGGRLLAPTFCHGQTWRSRIISRIGELVGFPVYRRFTDATLRGTVEAAGFEVERVEVVAGAVPICFLSARRSD